MKELGQDPVRMTVETYMWELSETGVKVGERYMAKTLSYLPVSTRSSRPRLANGAEIAIVAKGVESAK